MEREKLKSRLGFILLSAGCAIGIGNVWKFPYIAGQGGGGAFVLFYLIFLVILGLPIMTMEFAVGRASRKSPVRAYQALEKPGQKWHIHGYLTLIGCYLLMMFYTTVAGWMLHYFYMTATGKLAGLNADQVAGKFTEMLASPGVMTFWMVFVVVLGIFVCAKGLQNGLERVTKVMMIALLVIMVVLAVNSLFMPGAKEGLSFFLVPDFARMKEVGVVNTLVSAMNQAFFTLSLGIGAMSIFGSYIGKEHSLLGESARIVVLDTFVAITAGLIIFPACFTYGVDQTSGPSLIFITLPNIFANMAMGRLWGTLFFLFMAFAALSTVLAVFENIICCGMELTGCSRKKSSLVNFVLIIAAVAALRAGLQRVGMGRLCRVRRRCAGFGGLPRQQPVPAAGQPGVPAVLRHQVRLGLGQLQKGSQHRQGPQDARLDARLPDLRAAGHRAVHLCLWHLRQILRVIKPPLISFRHGVSRDGAAGYSKRSLFGRKEPSMHILICDDDAAFGARMAEYVTVAYF